MKIYAKTSNGFLVNTDEAELNKIAGTVGVNLKIGDTVTPSPKFDQLDQATAKLESLNQKINLLKTTIASIEGI